MPNKGLKVVPGYLLFKEDISSRIELRYIRQGATYRGLYTLELESIRRKLLRLNYLYGL